jgi:hypothetical protein
MISKMLYVAGMKTESEFAEVYLDFIRKYGIPSALRRDNSKSEMSQRGKDIHRDLIIADQWTEPHSPLSIEKKNEMMTVQFISVWWYGIISIRINHG